MYTIQPYFSCRRWNINSKTIILASSSPYRKALLERLKLSFTVESPDIDEQHKKGESIQEYVSRLAEEKSFAVASGHAGAIVIGSDQALEYDGKILGKPGSFEKAKQQLQSLSSKKITFYTGLCVTNTSTNQSEKDVISYHVYFRELNESAINNYLSLEQPYDCAGSFKSEKLGISLVSKMEGDDPTALIGLPLIRLSEMLRSQGVDLP